ncbi:PREDICTED: N-acetylglucosaminyl-phosphatidylinositol biosynthetic protein-like [Amphimedon queenslandica]|uniref:phosphatidylinositol N-acetylglucosaminyltransferase n=1 Tax=Amphimedon queenslandica TaxID=400682 RepID=A0A1X7V7L2_AMPQE|nr:PREDICTED: N-acetylglucosaminyl-phosphatidylinositol biosynthetic protein-like [Amphimedon queenslandica]|eukprot:XP_011403007.2 PREDICTED: N-acetylglucosaminyl-phosphatidylinositol biosynthetic protein-like [Amphimedon queenslandica]
MKHCICMVSDFFYPNTGGIENHIFTLSQHLIKQGHKVIGITHQYNDRVCVRYLSNYFKVYYVPFPCFYLEGTFPFLFCSFGIMREIFIRENVTIIHGHGAFSGLCGDSMFAGSVLGLPTVFTDHSLFGFADISSIITNKFLEFFLSDVSRVICVSYTSKENTVLRAALDPNIVNVIPNAIDSLMFSPDPTKRHPNMITIVIVSRLVLRKGADIMAAIIPIICERYPDIQFLIAGDGPKRVLIEEVREKHFLQERVQLTPGMIPHSQVRDILVQGDIFLNTSLTEAFCMAIVEAASCGLQVVSTNVGGIPEVLPNDLILLAEPNVSSLVDQLEVAITNHRSGSVMPAHVKHQRIKELYNWSSVTERTIKVYNSTSSRPGTLTIEKLQKYYNRGSIVIAIIYVLGIATAHLLLYIIEWIRPKHLIDKAASLPRQKQE